MHHDAPELRARDLDLPGAAPRRIALLVAVDAAEGPAGLLGANADMDGWEAILNALGVDAERRWRLGGGDLPATRAGLQSALEELRGVPADELLVLWSGHGVPGAGGLALRLHDGEIDAHGLLGGLAGPSGRGLRAVLDCCGAEGVGALPHGGLALVSGGLGGEAQRVHVEGRWRGLLSWALQRALEQWLPVQGAGAPAVRWATLAERASSLMGGLCGRGLHARCVGEARAQTLAGGFAELETTRPRLAAQIDHELTLLWQRPNGTDLALADSLSRTKLSWGLSFNAASAMPASFTMTVAAGSAPTSGYTYTYLSDNADFSTTTQGPTTAGGRLYKANVANLWVKVRNDTQRITFYVGSTLLSNGRLVTGSWDLAELSQAPTSPPTGGWYVCADDLV